MTDTDKHKGQYFNGKLVGNYLNMQLELKRLREGIKNVVEQLTHPISYGYNDVNNEEHIDNLKELIKDGQ